MPNYVTNILTIPKENLQEVITFMKSDERKFDFNNIIPTPKILENTMSGSIHIDGKWHNNWIVENKIPGVWDSGTARLFTEEEKIELAKIGFENSIDWRTSNWGTKWNAGDILINEEKSTIEFSTAWSNVTDLMCDLSLHFPNVVFGYEYSDEDTGSQCGIGLIKNGIEMILELKDRSKEAYELCFKHNPGREENYELIDGEYCYKQEDVGDFVNE